VPKAVTEITEGVSFSRSGEDGQIADAQPRVFRLVLNTPGELIDIQGECGVRIGDELRPGAGIFCTSFDARFEGNSRLVLLCTFLFKTTPSQASSAGGNNLDPKSQAPNIRPANWAISSAIYEQPVRSWRKRTGALQWGGAVPAANPVNDFYDNITAFDALVTISIDQFEPNDPTRHANHVGAVNEERITLGSLACPPHTVMLRGISSQPVVESWGGLLFRGWNCTYEFAYKVNKTSIHFGADGAGGFQEVELGWDIAVPQTGFNVKAFNPPGLAQDDPWGQPLKKDDNGMVQTNPLALFEGVAFDSKQRAMVQVAAANGTGASQSPSAQPIALNDSGRPRKSTLIPLVYGYQVHRAIDITQTLALRLF
jgi:hypothetical protein